MSAFRSTRGGDVPTGIVTPYNQGLLFSPVTAVFGPEGVDSVTTASGLQLWQGNRNTLSSPAQVWPLQKASGHDVYRFETRPGDQGYSGDNPLTVSRSLLVGSNHPMSYNTTWYFSCGFMVEPGFAFLDAGNFLDLMQFFPTPDVSDVFIGPLFFVQLNCNAGDVLFTVNTRTSNTTPLLVDPGVSVNYRTPLFRGLRYQLFISLQFKPAGGGFYNVYLGREGQASSLVWAYSGATGFNDTVAPYMDFGCYNSYTGSINVATQVANPYCTTTDISAQITSPVAW